MVDKGLLDTFIFFYFFFYVVFHEGLTLMSKRPLLRLFLKDLSRNEKPRSVLYVAVKTKGGRGRHSSSRHGTERSIKVVVTLSY